MGCIHLIIYLLLLGVYVHVCARYKVSVIKLVARRTVHDDDDDDDNDANTQQTILNYIASSALMHFAN